MSGELSLFGDEPEEPAVFAKPARPEGQIADWLVDSLREALSARGLTEMAARQGAIEAAAGRPVESLRSLTRGEAMRVLAALGPEGAPASGPSTSWDDREGDTWIDRI